MHISHHPAGITGKQYGRLDIRVTMPYALEIRSVDVTVPAKETGEGRLCGLRDVTSLDGLLDDDFVIIYAVGVPLCESGGTEGKEERSQYGKVFVFHVFQ